MTTGIQPGFCLGPYEIKDILGSGALGVVYRARQPSLDRDVAIKVLSTSLALDDELVERFRREARTAASLRHPHIVTVHDTGFADGYHYIAMELLTGTTLDRLPLPLPPASVAEILSQLAEALAYAHKRGVVHRDLKPENALIDDSQQVTLTDFGVARVVGQASLTLGGGPIGTPEFMSPEQARGELADARSDVYALGVLGYYLLTGVSPFRAETALATMYRQIHAELPPFLGAVPRSLGSWIAQCCCKDPSGRFASGEEARAALSAVISEASGWTSAANPLDSILRGEMSLAEALTLHREREAEIRSTFQRELTVLNLDMVRSSLLKAPGQTILASFTFAAFRRYVEQKMGKTGCLSSSWSGDGLVALFPTADSAVTAANDILEGLPEFNSSESGLEDPVLVRIGLHTGRILMSDSQRLEQVASPTLDTAGRLQKCAAPNALLMTEVTWSQLSSPEAWHRLLPIAGLPVGIYGVAPESSPSSASPAAPALQPAIPGRGIPPSANSTLVRSATNLVPEALVALSPGERFSGLRHGKLLWSWMLLVVAGAAASLFLGRSLGGPVPFFLWIASLVTAAQARRQVIPNANSLVFLSLGGLAMNGIGLPFFAQLTAMTAICVAGMTVVDRIRRDELEATLQERGFVVLERMGPECIALPPPARDQMLDEMAVLARRLGYRERQLGLHLHCEERGVRLRVLVQAVDRDTGLELARAELEGDRDDASGLIGDVSRRLLALLPRPPAPALAAGVPPSLPYGAVSPTGLPARPAAAPPIETQPTGIQPTGSHASETSAADPRVSPPAHPKDNDV